MLGETFVAGLRPWQFGYDQMQSSLRGSRSWRGLSGSAVCGTIISLVSSPPDSSDGTRPQPDARLAAAGQTPQRGGVYWVEVDSTGEVTPNYRHPHVVIQDDVLNQSRIHTVVVCAISTNLARATEPGNVRLDQGEGNLPKPSIVIVSQVSSIPKSQLGHRLGTLSELRVEQIYDGLRFQQRAHFHGR